MELTPRSPRDSMSVIAELMLPQQANNHGSVFGGVILAMVDRVAGVVAQRHCRQPVVTASIDRVDFREPVHLGELVTCQGRISYAGRTSIEVLVEVTAEDLRTGVQRQTNHCYLTMVALGPDGRPTPVPPILAETDEDRRLLREGEIRRQSRLRMLEEIRRAHEAAGQHGQQSPTP